MTKSNRFGAEAAGLGSRGVIPAKSAHNFAMGVDLGQSVDPTAICIVEQIIESAVPIQIVRDGSEKIAPPVYHVRHIERLPLQTTYPAVIGHVRTLLSRDPLVRNCSLVIDHTGVGRAVYDMFRAAHLQSVGVTITAGETESRNPNGSGWHVSKLILISKLQALLHAGDLKIARSLPDTPALISELQDFRANISDAGNVSFGARVGKHDDLVLALAIAVWWLSRNSKPNCVIVPLGI